jgi:hypothetical protein
VINGGRFCSTLLTLVPFPLDNFYPDFVGDKDVSPWVSATKDMPKFLTECSLAFEVLDFIVGYSAAELADESGHFAAFVTTVRTS